MARGNIKQRSKGSWFIRVELEPDPITGKRRQKAETFTGNKRDADARLNELINDARQGTAGNAGRLTVADFIERWLTQHAEANTSPKTYLRYRGLLKTHVVPRIGSVKLEKLRPHHILDLQAALRDAPRGGKKGGVLAPRTRHHVHRVLHTALAHAVRWHLIAVNPAAAVAAPRVARTEMRTLDGKQTAALLAGAAVAGPQWHAYYRVAVTTGMRLAEMTGLRWQDVDLAAHTVTFQQTIQRLPKLGLVVKPPKTTAGRRTIPLGADVLEVLQRHKVAQIERRLKSGPGWHENGLVFPGETGNPIEHKAVRAKLWALCDAAELPRVRVHDLRHTAATLLLLAGVNAKVVSERLGHSSIAITLQTYSHVLPTMQTDAAAALDGLLRAHAQTA